MPSVDKTAPARRTRLPAEQRRESILDAATEVFAAAGYRATKVSDVAARVGVTEPVIFQNFGSKAALYAAVLDRVAGRIRAELQDLAGQHGSVPDLLAHVLSPSAGHPPHGLASPGAIFADAAALTADPGLGEPAGEAARTLAAHLADLLRRGQAEGDIRANLDAEAAAWLLLSVLSARPWRAAVMPDPDHLEGSVAALALQSLLPPAAAPPSDTRSALRGFGGAGVLRCQQRTARLSQFRADRGGPQRAWIEPDLDAAALGVDHRPVIRPDPESVHNAGSAQMIEPQLYLHGADARDRLVIGDRELLDYEEHLGKTRLAGVIRPAGPGPVGGQRSFEQHGVPSVVHHTHRVQVLEVDPHGLRGHLLLLRGLQPPAA